jgi:hypothetical protein
VPAPVYRIVVLYENLVRTPIGEIVDVDARIEHIPAPGEPKRPPRQGSLEVCRTGREVSLGQWRPR